MKASIHYSKGAVLVLSFLLAFLMLMPVNTVYAASSYTVTGTETSDELTKVIDGTTVDASGIHMMKSFSQQEHIHLI